MNNIVDFKTGERPLIQTKGTFPYDRLIRSLQALKDTTKCVILDKSEMSQNQLTCLRGYVRRNGMGWVKVCKQDGKWHMWIVDEGGEKGEK